MRHLNEFYDYPVTGTYRCPRCSYVWEYYPETSAPHPQPCPTDTTKTRYRVKLLITDPAKEISASSCVIFSQETVTDLSPQHYLLSIDMLPLLSQHNATTRTTASGLSPLTLDGVKINFQYEVI